MTVPSSPASTPLSLHRAAPVASEPARYPVLAKGFRPFFLLAAGWATLSVPLWLLALYDVGSPGAHGPLAWHAHEMVFGFSVAVIAGFLLTAVGNWTGRETLVGGPLLALAALWVAGRVAMLLVASGSSWIPALVELSFLPALVIVLARPLIAARNAKNGIMVVLLVALFTANLVTHLDALGVLPGFGRTGLLVGVDVIILVVLVIAGRIIPTFTRSAMGSAPSASQIRSIPSLDGLTVGAMAALIAAETVFPNRLLLATLAVLTAVLAVGRAVHWGTRSTWDQPLLWILHLGYAWIPLGLLLRAAASFSPLFPAGMATHALTAGAIGTLTIGMMARVSLGHTGRPLSASPAVAAAFVAVSAGAAIRVSAPLLAASISPAAYLGSLAIAGSLWSAAFAVYLIFFARLLTSARPDGGRG